MGLLAGVLTSGGCIEAAEFQGEPDAGAPAVDTVADGAAADVAGPRDQSGGSPRDTAVPGDAPQPDASAPLDGATAGDSAPPDAATPDIEDALTPDDTVDEVAPPDAATPDIEDALTTDDAVDDVALPDALVDDVTTPGDTTTPGDAAGPDAGPAAVVPPGTVTAFVGRSAGGGMVLQALGALGWPAGATASGGPFRVHSVATPR
jgi:hypothetical protein